MEGGQVAPRRGPPPLSGLWTTGLTTAGTTVQAEQPLGEILHLVRAYGLGWDCDCGRSGVILPKVCLDAQMIPALILITPSTSDCKLAATSIRDKVLESVQTQLEALQRIQGC